MNISIYQHSAYQHLKITIARLHFEYKLIIINNNNNYDNLYGAVTRPYRYKGASQATKQGNPYRTGKF